jgi:hypothetical protein
MADASPSGPPDDARQEIARQKFACPACGAEAVWNPARQALVCPFCGTISPATIDATGAIVEHDRVAALRGVGDDKRGWQIEKRYVKCRSCQAISVMDASRQAQRCEFCGSAELVPYAEVKDAFRPESVLPFTIGEDKARDGIRAWYGRLWLAPNKLKRAALTDTVKGVYLPYWTFDAKADASWTAEAGHYYYTTETYTDGSGRTQTRQVRQIRWEPAAGRLQHVFDDDLVCASVGVHPGLLRGVEPFPTGDSGPTMRRTSRAGSSNATRSIWSAPPRPHARPWTRSCAVSAPPRFRATLIAISTSAPSIRGRRSSTYSRRLAADLPFRIAELPGVMNGVTGMIQGEYPKSWVKLTLLGIAILVAVIVVLSLGTHR